MLTLDAALKAVAAASCATFAAVVLAGGPRRPATRWLAAFLLLIAGNQAAEAVRALATDASARAAAFRVATAFAAVDPAALAGFILADAHPSRRRPAMAAFGAASAALVLGAVVLDRPLAGDDLYGTLLTVYTAVAYVALAAVVAARFLRTPQDPAATHLLPAMLVAAVPVVARLSAEGVGALGKRLWAMGSPAPLPFVSDLLILGALVAGGLLAGARLPPPAGRVARASAFATAGVTAALAAFDIEHALSVYGLIPWHAYTADLGRAGAAIRWLLFGVLVSIAIVRHDMLAMGLRARRRAARALVALAFAIAAALALGVWQAATGANSLSGPEFLLLAGALALSQGFRRLVDAVAHRVYGVPMPGDVAARHESYRLAAAAAASQGRAPSSDPGLQRLRDELELDGHTASVLERAAESSVAGPLVPGQRVAGRYLVQGLLGRGGAGRTFRAHDELLGRDVAIKEVGHDEGEGSAAMLREARIAGGIQHPRVVVVHDLVTRPGATLLVEEYVEGGSLAQRLAVGRLPAEEGVRLLEGVLEGLAAVHAAGVVHRDLKPENVLLTPSGAPKIADFGIAVIRRGATAQLGRPGALLQGTVGYMSPEQLRGETPTPASDVYAFGQLARRALAPPLGSALEAFLDRCTAEEAGDRWRDASEALAALRRAAQVQ